MKYLAPLILGLFAVGCANPKGATALEQRNYVNKMHDEALRELYSQYPDAREQVVGAAGHAVFRYFGTNFVLVATEGGYGVVVDHETDQKTYMKLRGGGLGIGVGAKDAKVVMVFNNKAALEEFVQDSGKFTLGASTEAVAKSDDQGNGRLGVAKSGQVKIYTLAGNGFALAASVVGTRFYRDQALNAPDDQTPNPATETVAKVVDLDAPEETTTDPTDYENYENRESTKTAETTPAAESEKTADTQPNDGYDD
jgi:lipid-binding SYLF domain-containing protein